jgi:nucleotide-binding universal stress UspA family protein
MYSRILVPIDGSSTSKLGLIHALRLAKDQQARVRLLNVLDETVMMPAIDAYPLGDMGVLLDSLEKSGKEALAEGLALCRKQGVTAEKAFLRSRRRFVSDAILADARKWHADVIVMGTHGRRGLNRLLLGSDAERVVREASVPVLLVRGLATVRPRATKRVVKPRSRSRSPVARPAGSPAMV